MPRCRRAVDRFALGLLGSHVRGGSQDHAGLRRGHAEGGRLGGPLRSGRGRIGHLGQAEVEHLHRAVGLDLDVGWLQIAMGDAFLVGFTQRVTYLPCDTQGFFKGKGSFRRLALDILHDQKVGTDVEETADVGVVERGDGPRLALETLSELLVRSLDGDLATQARVLRQVDFAHAAGADLGNDLVGAEAFARC
jgi:hypothetical protein